MKIVKIPRRHKTNLNTLNETQQLYAVLYYLEKAMEYYFFSEVVYDYLYT